MSEKKIESDDRKYAKENGVEFYKFTSPGRRSVPDRLLLSPISEKHQAIVAKYIRFIEYKAPGKDATEAQKREHERLRNLGFAVNVVDNPVSGKMIINSMVHE